jgi:hypothetical protein
MPASEANAFGIVHKLAVKEVGVKSLGHPAGPRTLAVVGGAGAVGAGGSYLLTRRKSKDRRVAKADKLAGIVVDNTVSAETKDVYRRARRRRPEAAGVHWGGLTAGNLAGSAAGMGAGAYLASKAPALKNASKVGPWTVSAAKKTRLAELAGASVGGTAGGVVGGEAARQYVKRNRKRYAYKEKP